MAKLPIPSKQTAPWPQPKSGEPSVVPQMHLELKFRTESGELTTIDEFENPAERLVLRTVIDSN